MQLGNYRTVDAYVTSAGTQSTHRADTDVATAARNGLNVKGTFLGDT